MCLFKKYRVVLKKDFISLKKELQMVKNANGNLSEMIKDKDREISSISALCDTLQEDKNKIVKKYNDIEKRKDKLRQQKEELTKNLKDTIEQLKIIKTEKEKIQQEFEEFKKNKFIVKEIPSRKPRKTQIMGIKSGARTSKIIKDVKEKL